MVSLLSCGSWYTCKYILQTQLRLTASEILLKLAYFRFVGFDIYCLHGRRSLFCVLFLQSDCDQLNECSNHYHDTNDMVNIIWNIVFSLYELIYKSGDSMAPIPETIFNRKTELNPMNDGCIVTVGEKFYSLYHLIWSEVG